VEPKLAERNGLQSIMPNLMPNTGESFSTMPRFYAQCHFVGSNPTRATAAISFGEGVPSVVISRRKISLYDRETIIATAN
jgi:hypothetical protein